MAQQGLSLEEWNTFKPIHGCNDLIGRYIEPTLSELRKLHADVVNAADMVTAKLAAREFCKKWDKLAADLNCWKTASNYPHEFD
jgi:hypothetical protein